jgi:hypothetical protein
MTIPLKKPQRSMKPEKPEKEDAHYGSEAKAPHK